MKDHFHPPSLGRREVIAAWIVCLAVAAPAFLYSQVVVSSGEAAVVTAAAPPQASHRPAVVCSQSEIFRAPRINGRRA